MGLPLSTELRPPALDMGCINRPGPLGELSTLAGWPMGDSGESTRWDTHGDFAPNAGPDAEKRTEPTSGGPATAVSMPGGLSGFDVIALKQ
mmetsp:Transcript_64865/g.120676  ORF Transcript_64865/g.120676 Transcript_64865/m.120676 type:complete len:91 (+) Transcript_64865:1344-1616(+)